MVSRVRCEKALRVASRWQQGRRTGEFACTQAPHSFDQVIVECVKTPRCRPEKRFAFVYRRPAVLQRSFAAPQTEVTEPEVLGDDDALPRTEEE